MNQLVELLSASDEDEEGATEHESDQDFLHQPHHNVGGESDSAEEPMNL
jgi:hypothetical protein